MTFDYDLFVIGAGSGGVRAARIAAGYGARVAVAESYRLGGTCVIRGCVPKKLLVYAARFHGEFEDAGGFGWSFTARPTFDWATLIRNKDKEIDRLEAAYGATLERAKVELVRDRAHLIDAHTIAFATSARRITAKTILIATGGWPQVPEIPGIEHAITSNEAFHLAQQPKSIAIVGGGYIAVEFAGIFNGIGTKTHLIYRGDKILRGFDEDVRDDLTVAYRARGVDVMTGSAPVAIEKMAGGHRLRLSNGAHLDVEAVMMATGRVPNTSGLGLEAAGVALGADAAIKVDAASRTNVDHIYAVGDVTNRVNLTPVAIREGHAFADSVFGSNPWTCDHTMIPTAVFSEPEVGTVGMAETDARKIFAEVDIYKARFRPMKSTLSGRQERMLMKLVVDAATQRVVGCHVIGPDAGEIVQSVAIAMRMGATKADFDRTMALHPSASEELVTMREKWTPSKS